MLLDGVSHTNLTGSYKNLFFYWLKFRVITDLDGPKGAYLMGTNEEGSLNIVTLLSTGRATPYLHNGVIYVGDEDHYVRSKFYFLEIVK